MQVQRTRAKVFVKFRHRNAVMQRVLDLAYIAGGHPIAVVSWVKKGTDLAPADFVELDERLLVQSVFRDAYGYRGIVDDPRFPPPKR